MFSLIGMKKNYSHSLPEQKQGREKIFDKFSGYEKIIQAGDLEGGESEKLTKYTIFFQNKNVI